MSRPVCITDTDGSQKWLTVGQAEDLIEELKADLAAAQKELRSRRQTDRAMVISLDNAREKARKWELVARKMAWLVEFYQGLSTCAAKMNPEVRHGDLRRSFEELKQNLARYQPADEGKL